MFLILLIGDFIWEASVIANTTFKNIPHVETPMFLFFYFIFANLGVYISFIFTALIAI